MSEGKMAKEVLHIVPIASNSVDLFCLSDVGEEPFCPVKIGLFSALGIVSQSYEAFHLT
jgi:hypothetical protein